MLHQPPNPLLIHATFLCLAHTVPSAWNAFPNHICQWKLAFVRGPVATPALCDSLQISRSGSTIPFSFSQNFMRATIGDLQRIDLSPPAFPESHSCAASILTFLRCPDNAWLTVRTECSEIWTYSRDMLHQNPTGVSTWTWSVQCISMKKRKKKLFDTGFQSCYTQAFQTIMGVAPKTTFSLLIYVYVELTLSYCSFFVREWSVLWWDVFIRLYSRKLGLNSYEKPDGCCALTLFPPRNSN